MNWDQVEGQWKQLKGSAKQQWGKLTDDDLEVIAGKKDQLLGKLRQRYGIQREEARKQADEWCKAQKEMATEGSPVHSSNVWSAAELQAKNERDRVGLRKCIRPSLEGKDSGPRWNALRSLPIYYCSLGRLWTGTGFESAGFDRCAISWFASKPGRKS